MTAGLRFFYRHIYITGLENIPATGPVIIIANHNSSLMDAALLGILLKRKAWFFARGDVFVNKPVQTFLWWMHMMPVHDHQGGRRTLTANNQSFASGQRILSEGGIIVFFPESRSHVEHRLLSFRKGVFRLAFDAASANNFSANIPIVPVGITYDHPVAGRTSVAVHAGEALQLAGYYEEYQKNAAAALLHVCKDAHQAISQLVLHIEDPQRLETARHCLTICRNNSADEASAWRIASNNKLIAERAICEMMNDAATESFTTQQKTTGNYFKLLAVAGLKDKTVNSQVAFPWWKKLLVIVGFPLYLAGLVLNGLPVAAARRIVDKKVYRPDFYTWIFVACYSFMYFLWMLLLPLLAFFLWGWLYAAGLLLIMITTGIFAYVYKDWLAGWSQQRKWQTLSPAKQNELSAMRSRI